MRVRTLFKKKLYINKEGAFLPINESILNDDIDVIKFVVETRPSPYFISRLDAKEFTTRFTFMNGIKVGLIPLEKVKLNLLQ